MVLSSGDNTMPLQSSHNHAILFPMKMSVDNIWQIALTVKLICGAVIMLNVNADVFLAQILFRVIRPN